MDLHKQQIIALLKELDQAIEEPLEMIICGGAAGILSGGFARSTMDIDIVEASRRLSDFSDALSKVAAEHGLSEQWLNSNASAFVDTLPDDFRNRLRPVDCEFRFLKVSVLGFADLLFMKLAALRPDDVKDLEAIAAENLDLGAIRNGLDKLRHTNPYQATLVQGFLREKGLL